MGETMKGKTLLKGHALWYEGAAHDNRGRYRPGDNSGRAKCECGEMSEWLPSRNQRKAWHRDRKNGLRAKGN